MASSLNPAWTVRLASITYGAGRMVRFPKSGAVYIPPAGTFSIRLKSGGLFTLTEKDQTVYNFDSLGRLGGIIDRNGSLTSLAYTDNQAHAHIDCYKNTNSQVYMDEDRDTYANQHTHAHIDLIDCTCRW